LHIDQTCKKASKVLGFLKRNLKHCPSLMNTRNNVGPSTVPWGTPDVTWEHMEASPSTTTLWILLLRNASIHILVVPTEKDHQLMQEDLDTLVRHMANGI
jgi:hypothetical protein